MDALERPWSGRKKAPTKKPASKPAKKAEPKKPAPKKAAPKKAAPKKAAAKKSAKKNAALPSPASKPQQLAASSKTGKDGKDVSSAAKAPSRRKPSKVTVPLDDEMSPVRSSKTSGPLVRVTSSIARPPLEPNRTGTPAIASGDEPIVRPPPAPPAHGIHRLPPEVRPDASMLTLDENRGALSAHGYRLILMHPESLIEIQMALEEKIGLEAGQMIFRGGYLIGLREARRQKDADLSEEEIVNNVATRCAAQGWGIFTVESLDLWRHELIFRVAHSPFAYAYGKSSTGVDHMIRGVFSGVCEVIFDKKVVATESMCRAMGDGTCQFMVG